MEYGIQDLDQGYGYKYKHEYGYILEIEIWIWIQPSQYIPYQMPHKTQSEITSRVGMGEYELN